MNWLLKYFLRGLVIVVPIVVTIWVVWIVFTRVDQLIDAPVPGLGFVITVVSIILVGMLASNFLGRRFFQLTERLFSRAPFIKMVYSSIRDLVEAFVGEKKKFNRPAIILLNSDGTLKTLGFITREGVEPLPLPDHLAVYFPQSYNFAGNLLLVPRDRVIPVDVEPSKAMAFIVSAGISGFELPDDVRKPLSAGETIPPDR
jgi:uncharacterized membrane protein